VVGDDGPMGLWRIWTISHGHLDHSRDCHRSRCRVAPAIWFLVMCWRSLTVDARPFSTRTSRPASRRLAAGWAGKCQERTFLESDWARTGTSARRYVNHVLAGRHPVLSPIRDGACLEF